MATSVFSVALSHVQEYQPDIAGLGIESFDTQLQQAEDERSKAQRLAEDQYKITDQIEKDRATRLGQMVDFRQRVGTRGALIQQGQIGNQELARQGMANIGSVLGQTPQLQ